MTLTPELLTAMIVASVSLVTAVGAVIVNVIMANKVAGVKEDVAEVKTQAAVIVGHVNSEKTAAQGREAVLKKENELLRETLEENKKATALLAQSTAIKQPAQTPEHTTPSAIAAAVKNGEQEHLENIEEHTKETAQNTAKTDATVQELKEHQS